MCGCVASFSLWLGGALLFLFLVGSFSLCRGLGGFRRAPCFVPCRCPPVFPRCLVGLSARCGALGGALCVLVSVRLCVARLARPPRVGWGWFGWLSSPSLVFVLVVVLGRLCCRPVAPVGPFVGVRPVVAACPRRPAHAGRQACLRPRRLRCSFRLPWQGCFSAPFLPSRGQGFGNPVSLLPNPYLRVCKKCWHQVMSQAVAVRAEFPTLNDENPRPTLVCSHRLHHTYELGVG